MKKIHKWKIEKTDNHREFENVGVFIGSMKGFDVIRNAIHLHLDTEEGKEDTFIYSEIKDDFIDGYYQLWEKGKKFEEAEKIYINAPNKKLIFEILEKIAEHHETEIRFEEMGSMQGYYIGSEYKFKKVYGF